MHYKNNIPDHRRPKKVKASILNDSRGGPENLYPTVNFPYRYISSSIETSSINIVVFMVKSITIIVRQIRFNGVFEMP